MTDRERSFSADDFAKLCADLDRLAASLRVEHREEEMVTVVDAVSVLRAYREGLTALSTTVILRGGDTGEAASRKIQATAASWMRLRGRQRL